MSYFYPCKNCTLEKSDCAKRTSMRSALKGLGITSVKFNCKERQMLFHIGQRVEFTWRVYGDGELQMGDDPCITQFNATVIQETRTGLRYTVRVDPESEYYDFDPKTVFRNENLVINVKPCDMRAIDEPDRTFCPSCLAYDADEAKTRCQGFNGEPFMGFDDTYHPEGCLLTKDNLR